jgi:hypothetical protein
MTGWCKEALMARRRRIFTGEGINTGDSREND